MILVDENIIPSFHAHIYYDENNKWIANNLRNDFLTLLEMPISGRYSPLCETYYDLMHIGTMHDKPVGPHTKAMFLVAFKCKVLRVVLNHLMLHRNGLTVLLHPETGNDLKDHTEHATWIGSPIEIDLSKL
jgi:aromatic ring-cleaving dioxygenase